MSFDTSLGGFGFSEQQSMYDQQRLIDQQRRFFQQQQTYGATDAYLGLPSQPSMNPSMPTPETSLLLLLEDV
jgi:hypothetical protein